MITCWNYVPVVYSKEEAAKVFPSVNRPDDNIKWCADCGRYFNPKSPHECTMKVIRESQKSLEKWLKRYKVKEEN